MKTEIRVIGIDDFSYKKQNKDSNLLNKDNKIYLIGCIFRGAKILDGVISCKVSIDGDDATKNIIEMINKTKFKKQLRAIFLDGIAVAGFNVIDIKELYNKTNLPVIVIMRNYPNFEKIKNALLKSNMFYKMEIIKKAGEIYK